MLRRRVRASLCVKSQSWVPLSPVYPQPALDHPCPDPVPPLGDKVPADCKNLFGSIPPVTLERLAFEFSHKYLISGRMEEESRVPAPLHSV